MHTVCQTPPGPTHLGSLGAAGLGTRMPSGQPSSPAPWGQCDSTWSGSAVLGNVGTVTVQAERQTMRNCWITCCHNCYPLKNACSAPALLAPIVRCLHCPCFPHLFAGHTASSVYCPCCPHLCTACTACAAPTCGLHMPPYVYCICCPSCVLPVLLLPCLP